MRRPAVDLGEVVAEQARHRPPKSVDGLIRVPDDHEAGARRRRREKLEQLELRWVHVLKLVNQDEPEVGAHLLTQLGVRLQELNCARDEITEVGHAAPLHLLLVRLIGGSERTQALAGAGFGGEQQCGRVDQVLLHQGDEGQHVPGECV